MPTTGKTKSNLTANVDPRVRAYVILRARANDWTPSKTLAKVIHLWLSEGAPAVSDNDGGAARLPWDAAIKWELLLEEPALPDRAAMPRDNPLFARTVRR